MDLTPHNVAFAALSGVLRRCHDSCAPDDRSATEDGSAVAVAGV